MKIAFLSFYSGNVARGVETFVHELANRLVLLGHDVTVFQNGPRNKEAKYLTVSLNMKINWSVVSGETKPPFIPYIDYWGILLGKFTRKVLKTIDKNTDLLIPTNGGWQTLLCKIWTLRYRKKMVVTGQSGPGRDDRWMLWCFPDVFVGLSKFHTDWARRANPFVRSVTVHNGVDLRKFSAKGEYLKVDCKKPIILNVGALTPNKRQELTIRAMAKLKNGSLVLVGKGDQEKYLRDLGTKLLPERFEIMNFEHADMPAVYRAVNLFAFPTVPWESFGIAMVEAMASGLPVVANDDPIRREIVGDAGLFVDPTDTEAYARALKEALNKNWGDKPRKQAEKFDWDKIAEQYEELCKSLFQKK